MDGVRAANGRDARLGQTEMTDLPRHLQLRHRADGFFDRHSRIDAMLIVDVYGVDAEALERRVARAANIIRRAVDADPRAVLVAHVAELCREHNVVAAAADGAANEALVREGSVDIRGIEKVDAHAQ